MASWKAHGRLSIRLNSTFFAIRYGSGVMRRNICSSAVFTGIDFVALKFYLDRVVPHQLLLAS